MKKKILTINKFFKEKYFPEEGKLGEQDYTSGHTRFRCRLCDWEIIGWDLRGGFYIETRMREHIELHDLEKRLLT